MLKKSFYSRSCETKVPLQRTDSTKDGLKELAALLFTEGRVEGKGEIIGQPNRKLNRVESETQYDYFCNKPEKPGKTLSKQSSLVENLILEDHCLHLGQFFDFSKYILNCTQIYSTTLKICTLSRAKHCTKFNDLIKL